MKKSLLILAALVALVITSVATAAAVSGPASGTFHNDYVTFNNGSARVFCLTYENASGGAGLSCDWAHAQFNLSNQVPQR
jgi:hypothetical protein